MAAGRELVEPAPRPTAATAGERGSMWSRCARPAARRAPRAARRPPAPPPRSRGSAPTADGRVLGAVHEQHRHLRAGSGRARVGLRVALRLRRAGVPPSSAWTTPPGSCAAALEVRDRRLRDDRGGPQRRGAPRGAVGRRPQRQMAAGAVAEQHDALRGRAARRPRGSASIAAATSSNVAGQPPPCTSARGGGTRCSTPPSRGARGRGRSARITHLAVARVPRPAVQRRPRRGNGPAPRGAMQLAARPAVLGVAVPSLPPRSTSSGDARARPGAPHAAGSSSNTMPAISTSSPGSKPASSSARITPIALQSPLDVRERLLVLHVEARDQALDPAAADAERPRPSRSTRPVAARRRAGTRGARRVPRSRRSSAAGAGACTGTARSSSDGQLVEPAASRCDVTSTGTSSPSALAPLAPRVRRRRLGRHEVGLRQREHARQRARGARRAPRARARRRRGSRPGPSRRAARGRPRGRAARVRSTCARKSCPRPAPSLAPSIRPGMSASTSWRSPLVERRRAPARAS